MLLTKSKIYERKLIATEFVDGQYRYYFRKDYSHCDWALCGACRKNNRKLIDYILPKWPFDPGFPFLECVREYRLNIMQYFIARGADLWRHAINECEDRKLCRYLEGRMEKNWVRIFEKLSKALSSLKNSE